MELQTARASLLEYIGCPIQNGKAVHCSDASIAQMPGTIADDSTIKNSDKIVVIEEGTVAEQGAIQLLNDQGRFYRYWQEQSSLGY